MEKFNFLIHDGGCRKLPPGFRFQPTDKELVFQYLAGKTLSHPFPASVIPEAHVFALNPWDLPGDSGQDRYFFSNEEIAGQFQGGRRGGRATCHGYWKSTGPDTRVIWSKRVLPVVGVKRTLVFHRVKHCGEVRTEWIMNVYCIALLGNAGRMGSVRLGKWLLCHVFSNTRARISHNISTADHSSSSASSSLSSSSSVADSSEVSSSARKN